MLDAVFKRLRCRALSTGSRAVWVALSILVALAPLITDNPYYIRLMTTAGLYVILAMGLNVTVGLSGLLDMGYMAFYAVGAYTYAFLASPKFGLHVPFLVTIPVAVAAGAVLSLIIGIPTLRLRGDYLAIVTMGFAEIVRILLVNLDRPVNITNGPNGIIEIDPARIGAITFGSPKANYYLVLAFASLAYGAFVLLLRSTTGLRLRALKDDCVAAECLGINTAFYRVLAFVLGSVFASTAGVVFAAWQSAVFPQNFGLSELITVYCMVVLGGVGNPKGTLVGVLALVFLPEILRGYSVYRMLVYGALLVAMMVYRPQGLIPQKGHLALPIVRQPKRVRRSKKFLRQATAAGMGSPQGPVLRARGISMKFGGLIALEDVDLDLWSGEILSVIGPNGAGKTTLINILSGLTRPTSGDVFLHDRSIKGKSPHDIYRLGIARTFQNLRLFGNMTALENVLVGANREDDAGEALSAFSQGMSLELHKEADALSFAHRKALEMARAVAGKPDVLLLDEPAAGMNSSEVDSLKNSIRRLRCSGYSVVLVEHQMSLVMGISDRIIVLDQGRKIAEGRPEDIAQDPTVARIYLGESLGGGSIGKSRTSPLASREAIIELENVEASYGHVKALHGVTLAVRVGEIVTILGSNGAGKTTTLRTILGTLKHDAGTVRICGQDVSLLSEAQMKEMGLAVVPEGRRIFSRMTVEENLDIGAVGISSGKEVGFRKDRVYALFPRLKERCTQKAGTLSGGEQQMLALGRALMADPKVLILDEPSMGLAPIIVEQIYRVLTDLNGNGVTILMVEQNARRALSVAHRGYVMRAGTVVVEGSPEDLSREGVLEAAYLAS